MTKTRELSDFERGMVVGLHKGNHSATDIEKILRTTCINVIKFERDLMLWQTTSFEGHCSYYGYQSGCRRGNNRKIQWRADSKISTKTARHILGRIGRRKPLVSEKNREKRLKWVRNEDSGVKDGITLFFV